MGNSRGTARLRLPGGSGQRMGKGQVLQIPSGTQYLLDMNTNGQIASVQATPLGTGNAAVLEYASIRDATGRS